MSDGRSDIVPLDADHSTMVKFDSRSDQSYQIVRDRILEFAKAAPKVITKRFTVQRSTCPKAIIAYL